MKPRSGSGVSAYVKGEACVTVYFPIDRKGRADIACRMCPFLSSGRTVCQINKKPVYYPDSYIGAFCPLRIEDIEKGGLPDDTGKNHKND